MGILSSTDEITRKLRGLDEREFKKCVADLLEETVVAHSAKSDVRLAGEEYPEADLICEPSDEDMKTIVHCLQRDEGEKVTREEVEKYLDTHKKYDDVEYVSLITTGKLTESASRAVFEKSDGLTQVRKREVYAYEEWGGGEPGTNSSLADEIETHGAKYVVDWYAQKGPDDRRLEDAPEDELDKPYLTTGNVFRLILLIVFAWIIYGIIYDFI